LKVRKIFLAYADTCITTMEKQTVEHIGRRKVSIDSAQVVSRSIEHNHLEDGGGKLEAAKITAEVR
jgi:hypothetical protein